MAKSADPADNSMWNTAPDIELIPFLEPAQRAALINDRTPITIIAMDYDHHGRFGPKFVATFTTPDGATYQYSFPANPSRPTPRDYTNKWIRQQIKDGQPVPAVFCKSKGAYFLDKPGSDSERDGRPASRDDNDADVSEPPF